MKTLCRRFSLLLVLGSLIGCGKAEPGAPPQSSSAIVAGTSAKRSDKVLGPAVAGMFYPKSAEELGKQVDKLLAEAKDAGIEDLRGLVCPHAGYEYSGKTAAIGYRQLQGRTFSTVIVMGPSHTTDFKKAAIPDAGMVETPLGKIPISAKSAELGRLAPFAVDPKCDVRRPAWWQLAPKELPAFGHETPHTWEHSVEVQLPFLQRTLKNFEIVPVVFGQVDPEDAARSLMKVLDDNTLVVASSDLTHYLPYDVARTLDSTCVQAICSLNVDWFEEEDAGVARYGGLACGKMPILTLMHVARQKGWKTRLLDYRNSGDTTGDKSRGVVGYAAVAFYAPKDAGPTEKPATGQDEFPARSRKLLLDLARKAVRAAANGENPPEPEAKELPEGLAQPRACFVTLKKDQQLRGCIGSVFPREPLYRAVLSAGRSAAVEDHRFPPVKPDELKQIDIEVSVLTLPHRLKFASPDDLLEKLRPRVDGVVLRVGQQQGLFLPQVWEQLPDKQEFLGRLAAEKAGLEATAWKRSDAKVLVFQVEAFKESDD
jgi:MEMO1 family protein